MQKIENQIKGSQGESISQDIPSTMTFTFRGDIRDIATLHRIYTLYLELPIRSKSELAKIAVHRHALVMRKLASVDLKEDLSFSSSSEALLYLESKGLLHAKDLSLCKNNRRLQLQQEEKVTRSLTVPPQSERASEMLEELDNEGIPEHLREEETKAKS